MFLMMLLFLLFLIYLIILFGMCGFGLFNYFINFYIRSQLLLLPYFRLLVFILLFL